VHADLAVAEVENGVAEIAGTEIKLLPKSRRNVRDVRFAVLTEIGSVVLDHGCGVVVNALLLDLIDRYDQRDVQFAGEIAHGADGWSVRNRLCEVVPARGLLRAEVRAVEDLLETNNLRAIGRRLPDISGVFVEHRILRVGQRGLGRGRVRSLNQR